MSIPFSSVVNKNGIIQQIEKNCGFPDGTITGNVTLMAQFTADVNLAIDDALAVIIPASGTWQLDDSNHTDYPIGTTDLVSGQRDYTFVTDESGNLVLDIYKVMCKGPDGIYKELIPKDQQSDLNVLGFTDGQDLTGTPTMYDKTGNGIFLDKIPSYNSTNGLKIYVNREGSYMTPSDTTKKAGFSGLFHEYLVLKPSYNYARTKGLQNTERLKRDITEMEAKMLSHYSDRQRDVKRQMKVRPESNK